MNLWAALAKHAGVHLYLDNAGCDEEPALGPSIRDSVEVQGRFLMVHAAATCGTRSRQVLLPQPATVMSESNATICSGCMRFSTAVMVPGDVLLYTLSVSS